MGDKTFDALLEDRRQIYIRMEKLEQLCKDMYRDFKRNEGKTITLACTPQLEERLQALGLLDMDNTDNTDVSKLKGEQ